MNRADANNLAIVAGFALFIVISLALAPRLYATGQPGSARMATGVALFVFAIGIWFFLG